MVYQFNMRTAISFIFHSSSALWNWVYWAQHYRKFSSRSNETVSVYQDPFCILACEESQLNIISSCEEILSHYHVISRNIIISTSFLLWALSSLCCENILFDEKKKVFFWTAKNEYKPITKTLCDFFSVCLPW